MALNQVVQFAGIVADILTILAIIYVVMVLKFTQRKFQKSDVFILSAPSSRNPNSYTEKFLWIEKWFDYDLAEKLILSNYKDFLIGDILIDDHKNGKGQDRFNGELILYGSLKYPTWDKIKIEFEKGDKK